MERANEYIKNVYMYVCIYVCMYVRIYVGINLRNLHMHAYIYTGVPGGMDKTSGECSLG